MEDGNDGIPYLFRFPGVTIAYENLQPLYFKEHKKIPKSAQPIHDSDGKPKQSWMRVKEGIIKILIENKISQGTPIVKVRKNKALFLCPLPLYFLLLLSFLNNKSNNKWSDRCISKTTLQISAKY